MGEFCRQKNTCCKLALRGRALRCFVQARRAARVEQKTKQSRTQTLRARDKLTTNTKHTKKSAGPQGTPTTHPSQAPNQQKQRRRQHQWQHQLLQHAAKETKCIHGGATAANRLAGRLKQARKRTNKPQLYLGVGAHWRPAAAVPHEGNDARGHSGGPEQGRALLHVLHHHERRPRV